MRLSEAMVLGSTIIKHVPYFTELDKTKGCAVQCAVAAGYSSLGGIVPYIMAKHPITGAENLLPLIVFSLNDSYGWSIDEIAQFVSQYEDKFPQELAREQENKDLVEMCL